MDQIDPVTINHLRKNLSPSAYSYLTSTFNQLNTNDGPAVVYSTENKNQKFSTHQPVTVDTCLHSDICRKIIEKVTLGRSCTSNETGPESEKSSTSGLSSTKNESSVYNSLIGKIVSATEAKLTPRRNTSCSDLSKKSMEKKRLQSELNQTISNPLYKSYDPRGYVKTENELGLEIINEITDTFGKWILKIGGEKIDSKSYSVERLKTILHDDLFIPDVDQVQKVRTILRHN